MTTRTAKGPTPPKAKRRAEAAAICGVAAERAAAGLTEEAIVRFRQAIERDRTAPGPYAMLAALLLRVGGYEEAREMARKACRLGPHLEDTHLTLATVYRRMRQLDKALAEAKRAASIDPDSPDAALLVAILAREMGDPVKAQGDLRQILARPLASDVKVRALRTLGFALDEISQLILNVLINSEALTVILVVIIHCEATDVDMCRAEVQSTHSCEHRMCFPL